MLNFAILYYNKTLKESTFNPFEDELSIVDSSNVSSNFIEFPDKLKNMNGHPLRILLYGFKQKAQNRYFYFDRNFQNALETPFNATIHRFYIRKDHSSISNLYKFITKWNIDMFPITRSLGVRNHEQEIFNHFSVSYPHMMNNVVALVPKPKKIFQNTKNIVVYCPFILFIYILILLLVAVSNKYISFYDDVRILDIFGFIAASMNSSVPHFLKQRSIIKSSWLLWCIIIAQISQLTYLKYVLVPLYEPAITSLAQLNSSNINIYSDDNGIVDNMNVTVLSKQTWKSKIFENRGNAAFLGQYNIFESYIKWHYYYNKEFHYTIMPEAVVPSYGVYFHQKRSPYIEKLQVVRSRVMEMGLLNTIPYTNGKRQYSEMKRLSYYDFHVMFQCWAVNICLSSVVFLLEYNFERIYNRFNRFNRKLF